MEEKLDFYDYFLNETTLAGYDLSSVLSNKLSRGLTPGGYNGDKRKKLDLSNFDEKQVVAAIDIVLSHFYNTSKRCKTEISSYVLKHLIERFLAARTQNRHNYISNGAAILAMMYKGFEPVPIKGTPNAMFTVSKSELQKFEEWILHYEKHSLGRCGSVAGRSQIKPRS